MHFRFDSFLSRVCPKSYAVVTRDYKYIEYPELESGFREFYDLTKDPGEKTNLISDPSYAGMVTAMDNKLDSLKMAVR